jgi:uncharacterized protein (TIGR03437 family)
MLKPTFLIAATAFFASAADWPMYLRDPAHNSFNAAENVIGRDTVAQLSPAWTFAAGAPIGAGVTVVGGVIYIGAWDGKFYAVDSSDGTMLWSQYLGKAAAPKDPGCQPAIGVESQAVVVGGTVWVGGGDSFFYGLDQKTGAIRVRVPLADPASGSYLWSSVTYSNGALYIGISSLGDCPLVRGGLARIDIADPTHPLFRYLVPAGSLGSGVWSTPAIDEQAGLVYVTTGNGDQDAGLGLWGSAMLVLDAHTLEIKAHYFLPVKAGDVDVDWGSSPTLFTAPGGTPMVAGNGKDGVMYAFRRSDLQPVWTRTIAVDCIAPEEGCGSVSTPAFDGKTLFSGAGDSDPNLDPLGTVYAIDPQSGIVLWKKATDGVVLGPVTIANGLVFASTTKGLFAYDAATGDVLWNDARGKALVSQPVVLDGTVYATYLSGEMIAWRPSPGANIAPSGVVDAASFAAAVAPGGLFSIFGSNLAAGVQVNYALPLPTMLGDVTVTVNGVPAPLLYVSPIQINGQVPVETAPGQADIVVNRVGLGGGEIRANVAATAPALFQFANTNGNFALALNQDYSINGPDMPAAPGDIMSFFLTGAGAVSPVVPSGSPGVVDPLSYVVAKVTATIGFQPADVLFAGLAPSFVGLVQANVRVPAVPTGILPVTITVGGVPSNSPVIAVRAN